MEIGVPSEDIRKVLLGINLSPIDTVPLMTIGRWKVYDAGRVPHVRYDNKNINFQIHGNSYEKIVVRFFFSDDETILKVKYYYLKGTDPELAFYISMELISIIARKYPLDKNYIIKQLKHL